MYTLLYACPEVHRNAPKVMKPLKYSPTENEEEGGGEDEEGPRL